MPYNSTYPPIAEKLLRLDIKGFSNILKKGLACSLTVNWSNDSSISIINNPTANKLTLSYKANGKSIKYDIGIEQKNSNLGKGFYYYFVCAATGLKCRKLFLYDGYFVHRKAIPNLHYKEQTKSKSSGFFKFFEVNFKIADIVEESEKPYFKSYYKGKPTKLYQQLENKLNKNIKLYKLLDRQNAFNRI